MATYSISGTLGYSSTDGTFSGQGSLSTTQAGSGAILNIQNVGTTSEVLSLGDISAPGPVMISNDDSTNYVEVDSASAMDKFPQKILPGAFVILAPETATIYAKAHTAACNVTVTAVQL